MLELPLDDLVGGVDDGLRALEPAGVEGVPQVLVERDALVQDLWDAFMARRYERAKTVVDASNQLAQWQLDHVQGDIPTLMRDVAILTSQPA